MAKIKPEFFHFKKDIAVSRHDLFIAKENVIMEMPQKLSGKNGACPGSRSEAVRPGFIRMPLPNMIFSVCGNAWQNA